MWEGRVVSLQIAREAAAEMIELDHAEAVAGQGLAGDRYFLQGGTYSGRPAPGRQVTLIEAEAIEALGRDSGIELVAAASRRNITTRGVALNHLVGRRFRVGGAVLEGIRLCEPCQHLEGLTKPGVMRALVHRGGLRAEIVVGGAIRVGDPVRPDAP